jgi:hypothetical protein
MPRVAPDSFNSLYSIFVLLHNVSINEFFDQNYYPSTDSMLPCVNYFTASLTSLGFFLKQIIVTGHLHLPIYLRSSPTPKAHMRHTKSNSTLHNTLAENKASGACMEGQRPRTN